MSKRNEVFSQDKDSAKEAALSKMEKQFSMSQADFFEKEFGIKVKVFDAQLPSKGLLYAETHPLYCTETVEFTPMSTKEEDIIRNRKLIENATMGFELLRSCLVNKKIDPKSLFAGDSLAILYAIRAASYGPIYYPKIKCPNCGKIQKVKIDLNDVEIKDLPDDINPGINRFATTLPETGIRAEFKLLNEEEAMNLSEENKAREKRGIAPSNSTIEMMSVLLSINNIEDKGKINLFASRMPSKDSLHIRKQMAKIEPGLKNNFAFACEDTFNCRHEATLPIPFSIEFWIPDTEE